MTKKLRTYPYSKMWHWKVISCPSTKDALMECVWTHCDLYVWSIKFTKNHIPNCRSKNCSPFQSSSLKTMKDRFLPPPLPITFSSTGIILAKEDKEAHTYPNSKMLHQKVISCPSTKEALMECVCTHCDLYFGSIKSKQNHNPNGRSKKSVKSIDKQRTQSMRKFQP